MRLYTVQSLEVLAYLHKYQVYFPILEKCNYPKMGEEEGYPHWAEVYQWMATHYNQRKGHDFSSAPVWWYTSKREVMQLFLDDKIESTEIILQAEVPEGVLLLHDADLWETGPFSGHHLGWMGHPMHTASDWRLFDKLYGAYENNPAAMIATTPYIALGWLDSKVAKEKSQVD